MRETQCIGVESNTQSLARANEEAPPDERYRHVRGHEAEQDVNLVDDLEVLNTLGNGYRELTVVFATGGPYGLCL